MKNLSFRESLKCAWQGIRGTFSNEANFRFQTIVAAAAFTALLVTKAAPIWWAIFVLTIGGVLAAEMFNTALERLINHLHPEVHPSIKMVKDCAAGSVLILSVASIVVAVALILEHLG